MFVSLERSLECIYDRFVDSVKVGWRISEHVFVKKKTEGDVKCKYIEYINMEGSLSSWYLKLKYSVIMFESM